MNFACLHSDIISHITKYLDGHEIGFLYLCGSRKLCGTLENAVRHFSLLYHSSNRLVWPQLIRKFKGVLEFKLIMDKPKYFLAINLRDLPTKLLKLELNVANGLLFLMEKPSSTSDYLVPHYHQLLPLDILFPLLADLQIKGFFRPGHPVVPSLDFLNRLPKNLKAFTYFPSFSGRRETIWILPSQLYYLPESVESLHILLSSSTTIPSHWSFQFQHSFDDIIQSSELSQEYYSQILERFERDPPFPPRLKSLVISSQVYSIPMDGLPEDEYFFFDQRTSPSNIQSVDYQSFIKVPLFTTGSSYCSFLPPSVESLELDVWSSTPTISPIGRLPPNITSFSSIAIPVEDSFWDLPKNMTLITAPAIQRNLPLTLDFIRSLPRSLTDICISGFVSDHWTTEERIEAWKSLPPNVEQCSFDFTRKIYPEYVPFVPKGMKFLRFGESVESIDLKLLPSDISMHSARLFSLTDSAGDALPRCLRYLSVDQTTMPFFTGNCTLPPNLEYFFTEALAFTSERCFSSFPKYLRTLFTSITIYAGWLHLLPPYLTSAHFAAIVSFKPTSVASIDIPTSPGEEEQRLLLAELESHPEWMNTPSTLGDLYFSHRFSHLDFELIDFSSLSLNDSRLPWFLEMYRRMPNKMHTLTNGDYCSEVSVHPQQYDDHFNRFMISVLPRGVKTFVGQFHGLNDSHAAFFPPLLNSLRLYGTKCNLSSEFITLLPDTILDISLTLVDKSTFQNPPSKMPRSLSNLELTDSSGYNHLQKSPYWHRKLTNKIRTHENLDLLDSDVKETLVAFEDGEMQET